MSFSHFSSVSPWCGIVIILMDFYNLCNQISQCNTFQWPIGLSFFNINNLGETVVLLGWKVSILFYDRCPCSVPLRQLDLNSTNVSYDGSIAIFRSVFSYRSSDFFLLLPFFWRSYPSKLDTLTLLYHMAVEVKDFLVIIFLLRQTSFCYEINSIFIVNFLLKEMISTLALRIVCGKSVM